MSTDENTGWLDEVRWGDDGLVPAIAQDCNSGKVLTLAWMNREALAQLTCPKELIIVPGATHLFEEPGTLEQVADHAGTWFERYLTKSGAHAARP